MSKAFLLVPILLIWVCACGSKEEETVEPTETTPESIQDGLSAIIALYEARDFDALVRTRYAEIGKAAGEEQVGQLIAKLSERFSDEQTIQEVVGIYQLALESEPELSEGGDTAVFVLERGTMRFSRLPDGKWGFHL